MYFFKQLLDLKPIKTALWHRFCTRNTIPPSPAILVFGWQGEICFMLLSDLQNIFTRHVISIFFILKLVIQVLSLIGKHQHFLFVHSRCSLMFRYKQSHTMSRLILCSRLCIKQGARSHEDGKLRKTCSLHSLYIHPAFQGFSPTKNVKLYL